MVLLVEIDIFDILFIYLSIYLFMYLFIYLLPNFIPQINSLLKFENTSQIFL